MTLIRFSIPSTLLRFVISFSVALFCAPAAFDTKPPPVSALAPDAAFRWSFIWSLTCCIAKAFAAAPFAF